MPALGETYLRNLPLEPSDLQGFLEEMRTIFAGEPNILKVPKNPCIFVGDTHGDLEASMKVVEKFLPDENNILIFLGDYVDRGNFQLENVLFLFRLKQDYPNRIILLRGNHEEEEMNKSYGFHDLLYMKYMGKSYEIFQQFQQTFAQLPFCILTWNRIFGLHGGIPISMEGRTAACAHLSPLGNIAGACADLWSNESVQNIKLLADMAPTVYYEQLEYDTRLFNQAFKGGKEDILQYQRL